MSGIKVKIDELLKIETKDDVDNFILLCIKALYINEKTNEIEIPYLDDVYFDIF